MHSNQWANVKVFKKKSLQEKSNGILPSGLRNMKIGEWILHARFSLFTFPIDIP